MRLAFGTVLAVLLIAALGCGAEIPPLGSSCPLDRNGDGQLTQADFEGMLQEDQNALVSQVQADPLSLLPCVPLIQGAQGSLSQSGQ